VDLELAKTLQGATGGSDFVFLAGGRVIASTLGPLDPQSLAPARPAEGGLQQVLIGGAEYSQFTAPLEGLDGKTLGELHILRSFAVARRRIASLRENMIGVWLLAMLGGLLLTYALARRLLKPVRALDHAAAEIGRGNYDARVHVQSQDELGRLAQTFNSMCQSLRTARDELIRQERISTISRLSTSIVHDLRNPLAAIYGGAEMLVDGDLPPQHVKRLAANIYRSSRRVQELLSDLSDVTRGRTQAAEACRLLDVVSAAHQTVAAAAEAQKVTFHIDVAPDLELLWERSRMERVFENLFVNSIEAMPQGGSVWVSARHDGDGALIRVEDDGPGIPAEILPRLFQPFASFGKKNGMGLGLALSRQTVLDHSGDLTAEPRPGTGARFVLRLPL
jgi:signal transduction histidine kinase